VNVVRDRIARRAAALVAAGAPDVDAAIHQAAHQLGFTRGAPLPTAGEVRRHLQGMAQEALGDQGYRAWVAEHHALAAVVMDLLERAFAGPTLLAGRAARGQFDGGATLHVRLYTRAPLHSIAQALVDAGFAEPTIETIDTRHGRANRLRIDHEGTEIAVTRCLPEWWPERASDLVTGRRTATLDLEGVRALGPDPLSPDRP
jgi:hypothetical protein